jgi:GTPase SAR1 family protein
MSRRPKGPWANRVEGRIMKFAKIFKLGQKGAKRVKRAKGGAAPVAAWPEGTRVGVFGHENSGKTVFFTALYTQSKTTNDFHISVRDNATANEFFRNDMAIKGVDVDSGGTGTIAAKSVPKKFPDRTVKDVLLQFTAILDGSRKVPVVTFDYNGRAASISEHSDEAEKIRSFMADADGLLFFFDPKILGADPEVQARVSSFVNILELIVSLKSRLPIPVGLVITKADTLPGYSGEDKTILIQPKDEQVIAEDYETFLERVLGFESLSGDREWASSVRNILVKLREFIRVVVGRTLDFQIFFVSSTGNRPEKIGAEVGRSIYAPPEKVNPCGVTVPFHWILNSIVRSRRLNVLRRIAGVVVAISIVWIVLYSLPFMVHFGVYLRSPLKIERNALKEVGENHGLMTKDQNSSISNAYDRYGRKGLVKIMFSEYQDQAGYLEDLYGGIGAPSATGRLDAIIVQLAGIVADERSWPIYESAKDKLKIEESTKRLLDELKDMSSKDEEASAKRAGRALTLWDLFIKYLKNRSDAAISQTIWDQVDSYSRDPEYNQSEQKLGNDLRSIVGAGSAPAGSSLQEANTSLGAYDVLKNEINKEDADPAFVLGEAVQKLEAIRRNLVRGVHDSQISAIDAYVAEAEQWERKRTYAFRLQNVPDDGHIHYEVTESGENPRWDKIGNQYMQGDKIDVEWQPGQEIHIAFDAAGADEHWGKTSSDMIVLREKYSLFDMDGSVTLLKGNRIQFSYKGGLRQQLPKLR